MNAYAPGPGEQVFYRERTTKQWVRATVLYRPGNDDVLAIATGGTVDDFAMHGVMPGCWSRADEVIRWETMERKVPDLR